MNVRAVRSILYNDVTGNIELAGVWDDNEWLTEHVNATIEAGDPYKLVPVIGWGEATHRLRFTRDDAATGYSAGGIYIGYDFLVVVAEQT